MQQRASLSACSLHHHQPPRQTLHGPCRHLPRLPFPPSPLFPWLRPPPLLTPLPTHHEGHKATVAALAALLLVTRPHDLDAGNGTKPPKLLRSAGRWGVAEKGAGDVGAAGHRHAGRKAGARIGMGGGSAGSWGPPRSPALPGLLPQPVVQYPPPQHLPRPLIAPPHPKPSPTQRGNPGGSGKGRLDVLSGHQRTTCVCACACGSTHASANGLHMCVRGGCMRRSLLPPPHPTPPLALWCVAPPPPPAPPAAPAPVAPRQVP